MVHRVLIVTPCFLIVTPCFTNNGPLSKQVAMSTQCTMFHYQWAIIKASSNEYFVHHVSPSILTMDQDWFLNVLTSPSCYVGRASNFGAGGRGFKSGPHPTKGVKIVLVAPLLRLA